MINRKKGQQILWYESIGFLLLIVLSWLNKLVRLPHVLFGTGKHESLFHEAMMETFVMVGVWLVVILFTKRLLGRLHYLEGYLRVCAWCRKVGHEDGWATLENYFAQGFDIDASHGMCPECQQKWQEESKKHAA